MKSQSHINTKKGPVWYRCKRVEFIGDTASWELNPESCYSLSEAYRLAPHRQLLQATDDDALRVFVKAWGPLRTSLDSWSGSDPIETYRKERDIWIAGVRFLASVEEPETQRAALLKLSEFGRRDSSRVYKAFLDMLRTRFQIPGNGTTGDFDADIHHWLETVTQAQIEAATVFLVPCFVMSASFLGYSVEQAGGSNVLRASLGIHSLLDALSWMVWQDVFASHSIKFCAECRDLIRSTRKYDKKFCSYDCAHRKTARESARRKREERRNQNGTSKAR